MRKIICILPRLEIKYETDEKDISDLDLKKYFSRRASEDVFGDENFSNYFEVLIIDPDQHIFTRDLTA